LPHRLFFLHWCDACIKQVSEWYRTRARIPRTKKHAYRKNTTDSYSVTSNRKHNTTPRPPGVVVVVHGVHAGGLVDAAVVALIVDPEGRLVVLVDVQRTELPAVSDMCAREQWGYGEVVKPRNKGGELWRNMTMCSLQLNRTTP